MEENNNKTYNPLDDEETVKLFYVLMDKLLSESARGAILIGASHVEEALTDYVKAIMPSGNKSYQNKMLAYPGPLSSFSAKIELLYAFRYLNETTYRSLNALRKIRNEAAHNLKEFTIAGFKQHFDAIFDFITPAVFIRNEAMKMMVNAKLSNIQAIFEEHQLDAEARAKIAQEIIDNKERLRQLEEEQLPHWQLVFGLTLLCGLIKHGQKSVSQELAHRKSWLHQVAKT